MKRNKYFLHLLKKPGDSLLLSPVKSHKGKGAVIVKDTTYDRVLDSCRRWEKNYGHEYLVYPDGVDVRVERLK